MTAKLELFVKPDDTGKFDNQVHRQLLMRKLQEFGAENRECMIIVQEPTRTSGANRYYWGVVIAMIATTLNDAGTNVTAVGIHELYKQKYTVPTPIKKYIPFTPDGNVSMATDVGYPKDTEWVLTEQLDFSTTKMSKAEFYEYVEKIRHDDLVMKIGLYIPTPEEYERNSHTRIYGGNLSEPAQ